MVLVFSWWDGYAFHQVERLSSLWLGFSTPISIGQPALLTLISGWGIQISSVWGRQHWKYEQNNETIARDSVKIATIGFFFSFKVRLVKSIYNIYNFSAGKWVYVHSCISHPPFHPCRERRSQVIDEEWISFYCPGFSVLLLFFWVSPFLQFLYICMSTNGSKGIYSLQVESLLFFIWFGESEII